MRTFVIGSLLFLAAVACAAESEASNEDFQVPNDNFVEDSNTAVTSLVESEADIASAEKSAAKSGFWRRRRRTINHAERHRKRNLQLQRRALERSHKGHMERTNKERGTKESTAKHHARAAAAAAEARNKHHARAAAAAAAAESRNKHHARAAAAAAESRNKHHARAAQVRERAGKERTGKVQRIERAAKERAHKNRPVHWLPGWCSNWRHTRMLHGDPTIEQCQAACDRDSSCHQVVFESQGPWNTECWLGSNTMSNSQRPGASRNCDRAAARRSSLPCVDECYSKAGWTRNRAEETELDEQKSAAKSGFWRRRRRSYRRGRRTRNPRANTERRNKARSESRNKAERRRHHNFARNQLRRPRVHHRRL